MKNLKKNPKFKDTNISRRNFIGGAAATAAFTIVPREVLAGPGKTAPSDRINLACIGVGDQGTRDMQRFLERSEVRVIAVCDVDTNNRKRAKKIVDEKYRSKDCAAFNNFREMLDARKDIDAVTVITPDHSHTAIALYAMKMGKHVYCQKPLTHTVFEARAIGNAVKKYKVATQLGTSNQASEDSRLIREWIWSGAIGDVREVHNWSNRPIWPQGIDRPAETPPVPEGLDWDLWLGPAPHRPYHPAYLPLVWRGWLDFGTGALGDMGCYSFDTIFRALKLGCPTSVEGHGSAFAHKMWVPLKPNAETYPRASVIQWDFPARADMPPVKLFWYDGGLKPFEPNELEGRALHREGLIFVGDKGKILAGFSGQGPRLIPESKMKSFTQPPKTIPRSPGHYDEWFAAVRGGKEAGANFEFSDPVTEALLLGNVALRTGKKLYWDGPNLKVTNLPQANEYLHRPYRRGWTL